MESKILRDLMRTHGTLIESAIPEKPAKKGKSKHGTADGKAPFGEDDLTAKLAQLCNKKQTKKFLLEYYRERIAQLCAEDEF
jgi:hypothetical protein